MTNEQKYHYKKYKKGSEVAGRIEYDSGSTLVEMVLYAPPSMNPNLSYIDLNTCYAYQDASVGVGSRVIAEFNDYDLAMQTFTALAPELMKGKLEP